MSSPADSLPDDSTLAATPVEFRMPLSWRLGLSALLLFHITAVGVFPWTVPPPSELALAIMDVPPFRRYCELTYLDHGYKFFAPDPGANSRQIVFELEFADGKKQTGLFPDANQLWPRLLYHRYFMLAEHLPILPPEYLRSYARHLLLSSGAERVTLSERIHLVPVMEDVTAGMTLTDPRLVQERKIESFRRADVLEPAATQPVVVETAVAQ